jgi:hypothetical protein
MVLRLQVACFPFEFLKLRNFEFKYVKKIPKKYQDVDNVVLF